MVFIQYVFFKDYVTKPPPPPNSGLDSLKKKYWRSQLVSGSDLNVLSSNFKLIALTAKFLTSLLEKYHSDLSNLILCFVLVSQSCPTLFHPVDSIPPGSPVHGILQARILEWVASSFSRGSFWPRDWTQVSHIACTLPTLLPQCSHIASHSACSVGDLGSIHELGRSPWEGKGYPLQYSDLENSMDCRVHGVAKSQTWLSELHFLPYCRQILYHLSHQGSLS